MESVEGIEGSDGTGTSDVDDVRSLPSFHFHSSRFTGVVMTSRSVPRRIS